MSLDNNVVIEKSVFGTLYSTPVEKRLKEKGNLKYLPWAAAWAEVKKAYPNAEYRIIPQIIDMTGNTRFWHDDGRTGWVEVGVTIDGQEMVEILPIMDFKNKSIAAENITSVDANKSVKRCLVKACAMHGLGLMVYLGEELTEETQEILDLRERIDTLAAKKAKLSEDARKRVAELCRDAERKANPWMEDDLIKGNYKTIEDVTILTELEKNLLAVRK